MFLSNRLDSILTSLHAWRHLLLYLARLRKNVEREGWVYRLAIAFILALTVVDADIAARRGRVHPHLLVLYKRRVLDAGVWRIILLVMLLRRIIIVLGLEERADVGRPAAIIAQRALASQVRAVSRPLNGHVVADRAACDLGDVLAGAFLGRTAAKFGLCFDVELR